MPKTYIYHSGIKGQKWGERRYQYEDGTYTEEGKERRRQRAKEIADKSLTKNVKRGKDKAPISPAESAINDTSKAVNALQDSAERFENIQDRKAKGKKYDTTEYSDEELQKIIKRMELENRYNNLKYEEEKSGKVKVSEILSTLGDTVTILGGIAGIASTVYMIYKEVNSEGDE